MKNAFYITLKAFFILKIFQLLSWLFGHVEKCFDWKDKVHFKIYDVAAWEINCCNAHIALSQEVKKIRQWNLVS